MHARSWIIGSDGDCDLRVDSPVVSARHCRLTERGAAFLLEDLQSRNGTFVAGQRITGPCIVHRGDAVTLGQTVPLPWPVATSSITIGRDPGNDLVIPLDMVSSRHARLEREGGQIMIVDLDSSNGTAINDPRNKITRAALAATDEVFLGTHRVSAAQLIAALPREPRRAATMVEASPFHAGAPPDNGAIEQLEPAGATAMQRDWWASFRSPRSWLLGALLSALLVIVILGGSKLLRNDGRSQHTAAGSVARESAAREPIRDESLVVVSAPVPAPSRPNWPEPDEAALKQLAPAVGLLGVHVGGQGPLLSEVKTVAWAFAPNRVVCPTPIVDRLQRLCQEAQTSDVSLAVYAPQQQSGVVKQRAGTGDSLGTTVLDLDSTLPASLQLAADADQPVPGQPLAMLTAKTTRTDDPSSIEHEVVQLLVHHVERDGQGAARLLHCERQATIEIAAGAPVVNAAVRVVGYAESAGKFVTVVPISRLRSLLDESPEKGR